MNNLPIILKDLSRKQYKAFQIENMPIATQEKKACEYCNKKTNQNNPVKLWKQTGEMVCYTCRVDMVEDEFFPKLDIYDF